jgi:hypothetical protein
MGADGVVDLPEAVDLDRERVAVIDRPAKQLLLLQRAEEPLDDSIGLRGLDAGADMAQQWIVVDRQQRPMMHFDFQVGGLDSAVAEAVALGASVAAYQPQHNVRVVFDPASHPFCLCRDDG